LILHASRRAAALTSKVGRMASATPTLFTQRFNHLRECFKPLGQDKPLTPRQISDGVFEVTGVRLSQSGIAYWISGERQPSLETAGHLAKYFGVPTDYFTAEDVSAVDADLELFGQIKQLKQLDVGTMSARFGGLSTVELKAYSQFLDLLISKRANDNEQS
jgi:transcriptional regulator with XRE-family HTH domain